ncbi:MAG: hypothetical protein IJL06_00210 [Kiritimatiellae bacterium]|nr:hypothetical protein [Kiritimatiellia bacterium]
MTREELERMAGQAIGDPPARAMDVSEALARLDERYRAAKEEVDRLRDQNRAADEEISHLRDQNRAADEEISRLRARIGELEGARDAKDACDYAFGTLRKKPPLGLVPRSIRDFERVSEILEALGRYNDAGKPVPREWLAELEEKIRKEEPAGVGGVFFAPDMQPKTQLVQEVTR